MSTKNYDASQYTKRKRDIALGNYARAISEANSTSAGIVTVRTTQPTYQSAVIVTYQNLGKCYCNGSGFNDLYAYSVKGACGCGTQAGSS